MNQQKIKRKGSSKKDSKDYNLNRQGHQSDEYLLILKFFLKFNIYNFKLKLIIIIRISLS